MTKKDLLNIKAFYAREIENQTCQTFKHFSRKQKIENQDMSIKVFVKKENENRKLEMLDIQALVEKTKNRKLGYVHQSICEERNGNLDMLIQAFD